VTLFVLLMRRPLNQITLYLSTTSLPICVVPYLASQVVARKQLYNKLQELRGNIRVYARVRPLSQKEIRNKEEVCDVHRAYECVD
jgi:hypothetical protein